MGNLYRNLGEYVVVSVTSRNEIDYTNLFLRWFDARDIHGSVMPSASTMQSIKQKDIQGSVGIHMTIRQKDFNKALKLNEVREAYSNRNDWWESLDPYLRYGAE